MKRRVIATGNSLREVYVSLEEKPLVVVTVASGATIATALVLASIGGWPSFVRRLEARHSWGWLAVCLLGELAAYLGYVLTLRDVARVDAGPNMDLAVSAKTVVAGFGVFAATRSSGGFAVDYWAFRRAGANRRDAAGRVFALGFLEYAMLGIAALAASALLFLHLDGHASNAMTLPSLTIIPVFALALWLTSPKRAQRLRHVDRDAGRIRRSFANAVRGASNVRTLLTSPREHGIGVFGSGLYWAGDIVCLWAALQVVGGQAVSAAALVLAYTGGYVLTRRALPAGGAGIVEVALTFALVTVGLHFVPALIAVLIYRLFNFWLPIVPALALMPTIRHLRSRFNDAKQVT